MKLMFFVFMSFLILASCSNTPLRNPAQFDQTNYVIETLESPSGVVRVKNPNADFPITTVGIKNLGTGTIQISHLMVVSADGETIHVTSGNEGFGIPAGGTVMSAFSTATPKKIAEIRFSLRGTTESIEIDGINRTGVVPTGFSTGN